MTKTDYVFRVGFQDTDATGRVYFPSYVRWFDMAFIEYLRANGVVFDKLGRVVVDGKATNETFVIGEYKCRIERPSGYDDLVTVTIEFTEIRNKSIKVTFKLVDMKNEILATGYITYVYVDIEKGHGIELPQNIRKIFLQNSSPKK